MDQKHRRILRRNRVMIMRELPDMGALLGTPALRHHFSGYEQSQIFTQSAPSEKAAKFLEMMEFKSCDAYTHFLEAVRQFRPELARKLDEAEREAGNSSNASSPASNGSSSPPFPVPESSGGDVGEMVVPVQEQGIRHRVRRMEIDSDEDAGPYGLTGCGPGPAYHLSHLSYAGREYLSKHLNGNPPERNVFNSFCHALGVENRLIQASLRSRNPTGYLIQEFSERPEATFDKLEEALAEIGKREISERLLQMLDVQ